MRRPRSNRMHLGLLAALAVLVAMPVMAQPVVGVRASGVYTMVSSGGTSLGQSVGVGLTAFVESPITPTLSVVADLGYVQGGASDDIPRTTPESPDIPEIVAYQIRTHAVTIALAIAASVRADDLEPTLFVGPRLDIKLAEQTRLDGDDGATDTFPDAAFGLAGGAGVAVGRARIDLRGSFLWGDDSRIRQSGLELRLGVTL